MIPHVLVAVSLSSALAAEPDAPLSAKEVPARIDAIVALHRKGVVALASPETSKRDALDVVGKLVAEQRISAEDALESALIDELTAAAATDFKPPPKRLTAFLDVIEERPDLHDGDKLAFQPMVRHLVAALASTPGDGPRREALRQRLVADQAALDGIAERYREEARALLARTRGMVVTREAWESYVAFVRTVYSEDRVLADYADETAVMKEGSRGARRTDGMDAIYGFDLPDGTFVITFDDGPSASLTPQVLDILAKYDAHAVFFQNGKNAVGREDLVKRVLSEGHLLANHTLDHKNLPKQTDEEIARQIDESDTILEAASGVTVSLVRPPYGARDERVTKDLLDRGTRAYLWNVDSRDWADPVPESIAGSVLEQVDKVHRGVILFHDVHEQTVAALPMVLDGLAERGVHLVLWDGTTVIGEPAAATVASTNTSTSTTTTTSTSTSTNTASASVKSSTYTNSWGVVIGIDAYETWPKLSYAGADARGVSEALVSKFGFAPDHVIGLFDQDATRERILKVLGDELPAKVGPEDRVFVFYSGHGATRTLPSGGQRGYIVPVDAGTENLQSEAISMSELHDVQEGLPSKHVFFVMDACYGGLALTRGAASSGGDPRRYLAEITKRPARQILTAGGADEQVADFGPGHHSIFTWTLLQGLDGQADLSGDGVITASELGAFVAPRVSAQSRQTPAFGNLVGSGGGEFVFELAAGSELLSEATTSDPSAAEKAVLEAQLADLQAKLAAYEKTRGLDPGVVVDPKVEARRYHAIGLTFFKKGDYERARDAFAKAVEYDPTDVQAVNNLGFTDYQLQRYDEAIAEIKRALVLDPERAVAWENLGDAYWDKGDKAAAVTAWTKYLAMVPDSPYAARIAAAMAEVGASPASPAPSGTP